ncbi:Sodium/solute symporter [Trinorchestia longiramus]|nr:Sodium/solute symporter [Trinorchestia longiramus]
MYCMVPGLMIGLLVTIHVIMPVFYDLEMRSINEYMILRFKSPALKYLMLVINSLNQVILLGIVLYAPTLALAAVTPISSDAYILITGVIVTLYCSIGGMKAVVWTDFFQTIILIIGLILITTSSFVKAGGLLNVWRIARENGRLEIFNNKFGLYERHTTISTFILGVTSYGYLFSFNQASFQRIKTQRSLRNAKGVMYANLGGMFIIMIIIFLGGIGIHAVYYGRDPISLGLIEKRDQIMPFYVMHHLGFLTGVPGLFVACLISGTLSSISSILNAVPTMLWNDFFVQLQYFQNVTEKTKANFNKLMTMCLGIAMIGLAFLASRTQGVIQTAIAITSIVSGPMTGVFVLGLAVPIVGKKGAIAGFLVSICFASWICMGAQLYGDATLMLPLYTHLYKNNSTIGLTSNAATEIALFTTSAPKMSHPLWFLYNISYAYHSLIGTIVCLTVAILVTFLTGCEKLENVQPEHVLSCLKRKVGSSGPNASAEQESFLDDALVSKIESKSIRRLA